MTLMNTLISQIKQVLKDEVDASWTYVAVGTGTTTADPSDTELETEVRREARVEIDASENSAVTVSMFMDTTEANGNTLSEVGTFDAASSGNMWTRNVFTGVDKDNTIELWLDVKITFTISEV